MESRTSISRFQDAVQGIYRLFKVATFHRLDNDAVTRAIELSMASIRTFGSQGEGLSMLFARDTVIVNGRLLQAPPATYELAMEFGGFLVGVGINSFHIDAEADDTDLRALLTYFRERLSASASDTVDSAAFSVHPDRSGHISPHIRLRSIKDHLLLGLEDPRLSVFERVLLTYALAIRVIRQLLINGERGAVVVPPFFKRVSRQLALADYGSRPALLDVMLAPSSSDDRARHAVNAAIVAAAMVRRLVRDDVVLGRVAFEAMLLDFGHTDLDAVGHVESNLRPSLAAALAQVRTGELRGDATERALVAFEAVSLLRGTPPEQVYFGAHAPTLDARIVATSRAFIDALSHAYRNGLGGGDAFNEASQAAMALAIDANGEDVAALLHDAIGLIPIGVTVRTERGFVGIVTCAGERPTAFDRPRFLLVRHKDGHLVEPTQIDLADPASHEYFGCVEQIVTTPDAEILGVRNRMFGVVTHTGSAQAVADPTPAATPETPPATSATTTPDAPPSVAAPPTHAPAAQPASTLDAAPDVPAPDAPRVQETVRASAHPAPAPQPSAPTDFSNTPTRPGRAAETPAAATGTTARRPEFVREPTPARAIPHPPYATMTGAEALRAALRPEPPPASPAAPATPSRAASSSGAHRAPTSSGSQRAITPSGTHRTVSPSGTHRVIPSSGSYSSVGGQPAPGMRRGLVAREVVRVPGMTPRPPSPIPPSARTGFERAAHVSGAFASIEAQHAQPARRPSTMQTGELDALLSEYLAESGAGEPGDGGTSDGGATPIPGGQRTP